AYDTANDNIYVIENWNIIGNHSVLNITIISGSTDKILKNITIGYCNCWTENNFGENGFYNNIQENIIYDSVNNEIYAAPGWDVNYITVINGSTNQIIGNITVGYMPDGIAYDPTNNNIYVANLISNNITVISGYTNKVIDNISSIYSPAGIAYDTANDNIYLTNFASNNVTVISSNTNKIIDNITVGFFPYGLLFDQTNNKIYVANTLSNNVTVISGITNNVIGNILTGDFLFGFGMTMNSETNTIYVTNPGLFNIPTGSVLAISGSTDQLIKNIPVGFWPMALTYDSANNNIYVADGHLYLYNGSVVSIYSNNITVISGSKNQVINNIKVASGSDAILYDPANNCLYIGDDLYPINSGEFYTYNITVLNISTDYIYNISLYGNIPGSIQGDLLNFSFQPVQMIYNP
ncbi:MAG: YncE family protein, partial [Thermoplasmata archaeon]